MKIYYIIFFIFLASLQSLANTVDEYLSVTTNPKLSETERVSLKIIQSWKEGNRVSPVSIGENGEVEIIYGLTQPQILCAVLQITDVQFEPGEKIFSVHLGDTARWSIEPAYTGNELGDITHLIIKPKDADLYTSLVVTTDRRTYHMKLKSHKKEYYPMVRFHYPQNLAKKFEKEQLQAQARRAVETLDTGEYLGNLDFSYTIKGKAKFKPTRVYNDGIKTVIELPVAVRSDNAPTVMLIQKESADPVIVNYRLQKNRFIVDAVFDEAILISGIGMKQVKVRIIRESR